jgi:hypothetical protein
VSSGLHLSDQRHDENDYHLSSTVSATKLLGGRALSGGSPSHRLVHTRPTLDVPVQYFQSIIAIELAVAGALLWQIRYFETSSTERRDGESLPDARLRLLLALVLGATLFGSLWAIANEGQERAAGAVMVGLAVSLLPILLRVLPALAKDAATNERDPNYTVTVVGLLMYAIVVAGVVVLLNV